VSNEVNSLPSGTAPNASLQVRVANSNRLILALFISVCAAPVLASYLFYFVIKPDKRTNYGDLIDPQRAVPTLDATTLDGKPYDLATLAGRWVMLSAVGAACPEVCAKKLSEMRQIRLTTGKDRDRVELVWFVTDTQSVPQLVLDAYPNVIMLRADPARLAAWLPGTSAPASSFTDHLYMVDPHQHLMMRFPTDPDPYRVKRDLTKLLSASEIG
jgi:hypothetical protein